MQMQGKREGKNQKLCILNTISKSSSQSFCSKKKPKKKKKLKPKIKSKKKKRQQLENRFAAIALSGGEKGLGREKFRK